MDKRYELNQELQNKCSKDFIKAIRSIVYDVLSQMNLRIEKFYDGVVTKINNNSTVNVDTGDFILENLKNKTGAALTVSDTVRIYATTDSLIDAYVGIKLN